MTICRHSFQEEFEFPAFAVQAEDVGFPGRGGQHGTPGSGGALCALCLVQLLHGCDRMHLLHGPATEQRLLHDIAITRSTVDWILHIRAIRAVAATAIPDVFEILRNGQGRCWFVGRLILERTVHWWRGWGCRQPKREPSSKWSSTVPSLRPSGPDIAGAAPTNEETHWEAEKVAKKLCDQSAVIWSRHNGSVGTDAVATSAFGHDGIPSDDCFFELVHDVQDGGSAFHMLRCGAQRSRL